MAYEHLFDNLVTAWGTVTQGSNFVLGIPFTVKLDCSVRYLRYLATGTGSTNKPSALGLYRVSDQTLVAQASSITAPTGAGNWMNCPLTSACTVYRGVTYRLAAYCPSGTITGRITYTGFPVEPLALGFISGSARTFVSANGLTYPTNVDAQFLEGFDLEIDDANAAQPGVVGTGDLDTALRSWLSTDGQDHSVNGLPYLTKLDTAAVLANTADLLGRTAIPGTPAGSSIGGIAAWVWANRDSLLWAYNQLRSHFAATPDATYPEIDTNVLTLLSRTGTLIDDSTLLMAALTNIQADLAKLLTPPAAASWVLQDETDFSTGLAWNVPADVYTVSFSSLGSGIVNTVIPGGVDVAYRLAWWAPWNGASARDRRFIDFPEAQLFDGGVRMPGLVLHSPMGAVGHIQAWTYS